MKTDRIEKRIVWLACCALTATVCAMPTEQQISQAQSLVNDLTADDLRALKSKEKTSGDVAAAHLALADKAETEAGKYLLLQGAFRLYARSGDYDAAAATLQRMRSEIADLPPEVVVEIVNNEMRRVAAAKAPKVLAIFRDAQRMIKYRKQLAAAELDATAHPENARYQRRVAECHACLGDWPKALPIFAKIGAEAAKWELGTAKDCDAAKAADFWWNYKAEDPEPFKAHAAALYKKGLEDGSITGLRKTLAEKRVKEMEGAMVASSVAARGSNASVASGKAPSNALYCVIDLSAGPTANKYPVKWLDKPPAGGFNTDEYKTKKLVFRRIEPGKFKMGGKYEVTLTKPYYIGIFEMTQKQYKQVTGRNHSRFNDDGRRPVESVSWDMIRGDSTIYNWPASANVDPSSFMGKMQTFTGLNFDLPTEAQWEYACRAGSDGEFGGTGRIDDMGWYKDNSGGRTHPVGQKQANAWEIHDMHGNVGEWCLDWKGDLLGGETDPLGSFSGSRRIWRGSCWCESDPHNCGSSARWFSAAPSSTSSHFGFRLCMNPQAPVGVSARGSSAPAASDGGAAEPSAKVAASTTVPGAIPVKVKTHTIKLNNKVNIEFVECPAGTFTMGYEKGEHSPNRGHKVTITRPFWIARTKLTLEQYKAYDKKFKPRGEFLIDGDKSPLCAGYFPWPRRSNLRRQAEAYCEWLTKKFRHAIPNGYVFRLPTDAEWEYAYTAGETNPDDFYGMSGNATKRLPMEEIEKYMITCKYIQEYAAKVGQKYGKDYDATGVEVGKCKPNRWGLYDMAGNTCEMVLDTLDAKLLDTKTWYAGFGPKQTALVYKDEEVDPLRYIPMGSKNDGYGSLLKTVEMASRGGYGGKWLRTGFQHSFRIVVGPDLLKERGIKMPKLGK